ncbi:hypothetical protein CVV38_01285 [Candidatus Peregrinibacteria bacterium HGW-Peregrinibacteria-1]|jgi:predicted transcriptional regulator|nr:MAG: hypothetical protein CVV38_01285 [Candidatus Peregrinibacteria bacterium HGW-Peregrinibacteria-1]
MPQDLLRQIGFSRVESKIYLYLLKVGPQPTSVISTNLGINRTTAYQITKQLVEKGILHTTQKHGINHLNPLNPHELISYIELEEKEVLKTYEKTKLELIRAIDKLKDISIKQDVSPKIRVYQGKGGLKQAYIDTLSSQGPLLAYSNFQSMHAALPGFFPEYYTLRAGKKIPAFCLCPDNHESRERSKSNKKELRETVLVPEKQFTFSPELIIYNDKVIIMSWEEKTATIIESEDIANLHRRIFQLTWNHAKLITNQLLDTTTLFAKK